MNIAMISSWHVHAKGCALELNNIPDCNVVAVWDENKQDGINWAKELNCKYFDDYDELLNDASIDAVAINSSTSSHALLMIKAANKGKHIYTEKVLAITPKDCLKIKEAVEKNNVKFVISFPHKCRADLILAKEMAQSGVLGEITFARVRNAHNGSCANWLPMHFYNKEQCGGGAMIDLGAHTIYLLSWILGKPKAITSTFTNVTGKEVEDNAVSVMEFANGAIGVAETSFVSTNSPFTLEISGTNGSLLARDGVVSYSNQETGGAWVLASNYPKSLPNPLVQLVEGVAKNKEITLGIDDAVLLTDIMHAAYKSHKNGKKVTL